MSTRSETMGVRVAFHAINGVGLGHLTRLMALAQEIRAELAGAELLFITNARDVSQLRLAKLDFVRLPPRIGEPHVDTDRCRKGLPDVLDTAAIHGVFEAFRPELVVFDTHVPNRSWKLRGSSELAPFSSYENSVRRPFEGFSRAEAHGASTGSLCPTTPGKSKA